MSFYFHHFDFNVLDTTDDTLRYHVTVHPSPPLGTPDTRSGTLSSRTTKSETILIFSSRPLTSTSFRNRTEVYRVIKKGKGLRGDVGTFCNPFGEFMRDRQGKEQILYPSFLLTEFFGETLIVL